MGQKQREVAGSVDALPEEQHFVFQPADEKQTGNIPPVETVSNSETSMTALPAPGEIALPPLPAVSEECPQVAVEPVEVQKPSFQFGMHEPEQQSEQSRESEDSGEAHTSQSATRRTGAADRLLPSEVTYFHQMLTQFQTFDASVRDSPNYLHDNPYAIAAIQSLATKSDLQLTWEDLDRMEIALIQVMPDLRLRGQAWSLRARYFESSGPTLNALYLASRPENWDDATISIDLLRADLEALVSETQRNRVLPPEIDFTHEYLSETAGKWAVGLCVIGFAGFIAARVVLAPTDAAVIFPLATAFLSGGVGGFISLQSRLSRTARLNLQQQDQVLSVLEPPPLFLYPVQGAVLAALFYFLLLSGFIRGAVFPSGTIATLVTPIGGAHLVVWCFLIGLVVRFLPDIPKWVIRRLSRQRQKKLSVNV